ncbi:MAG TPA: TerB family tellurite resistance protein, partial [Thermoanaerobaculia bacterium]|nr:TerB family tellurite resistance protein [Thermoanaerobaculia bacterium]
MGFASLARFFREQLTPQSPEEKEGEHHHRIRLATASVLLETAYADQSMSTREQEDIIEYLRQRFELEPDDARELLETAEEHRAHTIDHFAMTNLLRQNLSLADRIEIVREMWRLVYGDGSLHQYENHLVRKLADLLGLEHHVMIEAKLEVQKELAGG